MRLHVFDVIVKDNSDITSITFGFKTRCVIEVDAVRIEDADFLWSLIGQGLKKGGGYWFRDMKVWGPECVGSIIQIPRKENEAKQIQNDTWEADFELTINRNLIKVEDRDLFIFDDSIIPEVEISPSNQVVDTLKIDL